MRSRRSVWNYIQRPKIQNSFNKYALIYFTISLVLFALMSFMLYYGVMRTLIMDGSTSNEATNQISRMIAIAFVLSWTYLFISTAGLVFLFVRETHKVAGPLVPIKRHIANLVHGGFHSRVRLRPGDAIHDIAADLNHLAANLEQWRSQGALHTQANTTAQAGLAPQVAAANQTDATRVANLEQVIQKKAS